MAYQLQEINRRIQTDVQEFLAECDDNYAQRVSLAADKILTNLEHSPIVLLSGPSGSGKTTTAMKIAEELQRRGVNTHAVAPRTPEGDIDYESPLCLDMELLDRHFTALSKGEEIWIPKYEFARHMRNDSRATPLKLGKNEIVVFEGIHALNNDIAGRHPEATKLYISARSNVNEGSVLRFKGTWRPAGRCGTTTSGAPMWRTPWRCGPMCAGGRSCTSPPTRTGRISSSTPPSPMRCR